MEKVSEGNLDAGLKIRSHDEIASLSKSFNRIDSRFEKHHETN